jgi:hypothetical protein
VLRSRNVSRRSDEKRRRPAPRRRRRRTASKKEYTFWESFAWHWKSRKFRSAFAALLTILLVKCTWVQTFLGIKPEDSTTIVQVIVLVLGMVLATITGEKYIAMKANGHSNGNGGVTGSLAIDDVMIDTAGEKLKDKIGEKLEEKVDDIVDKIKEKLKQ